MKIVIIALMFIVTAYGIGMISDNGKEVKVGLSTASRHLTPTACISIAVMAVAYDLASLYLLLKVV